MVESSPVNINLDYNESNLSSNCNQTYYTTPLRITTSNRQKHSLQKGTSPMGGITKISFIGKLVIQSTNK